MQLIPKAKTMNPGQYSIVYTSIFNFYNNWFILQPDLPSILLSQSSSVSVLCGSLFHTQSLCAETVIKIKNHGALLLASLRGSWCYRCNIGAQQKQQRSNQHFFCFQFLQEQLPSRLFPNDGYAYISHSSLRFHKFTLIYLHL